MLGAAVNEVEKFPLLSGGAYILAGDPGMQSSREGARQFGEC